VVDRREKSFFAPLMVSVGLVTLLAMAFCFVPIVTCSFCDTTGGNLGREWECPRCKGRGRVALVDRQAWLLH